MDLGGSAVIDSRRFESLPFASVLAVMLDLFPILLKRFIGEVGIVIQVVAAIAKSFFCILYRPMKQVTGRFELFLFHRLRILLPLCLEFVMASARSMAVLTLLPFKMGRLFRL